jgi:hypothetical protein
MKAKEFETGFSQIVSRVETRQLSSYASALECESFQY